LRQQEKRIKILIKFDGILCYFELKKMLKFGAQLMVAAAGWGRERVTIGQQYLLGTLQRFSVKNRCKTIYSGF
jgi:hypothetical protein